MIYENKVQIEGILSENGLEQKNIKIKGVDQDVISGEIKVKVVQKIDDKDTVLDIPVSCFATKITSKGNPNPAYDNLLKFKNEANSIASVGEEHADCVRITGASLRNSEWIGRDGNIVVAPQISASFINKIPKDACEPKATFVITFVVKNGSHEFTEDGIELPTYKIDAIVPQYGDYVDLITFKVHNPDAVEALKSYWQKGDTVRASGKLNYSFTTETRKIETAFGEPQEEKRTVSTREFLITGGSQPFDEGEAFPIDFIRDALAKRDARLEDKKAKAAAKPAPAVKKPDFDSLGF